MRYDRRALLKSGLLLAAGCRGEAEGPLRVAVAANFLGAAQGLLGLAQAPRAVAFSSGSTGQLTTQIEHGAPFEVFLAADQARPLRLERHGHGVLGTRFTYAHGRLALYGPGVAQLQAGLSGLGRLSFRRLAIANPQTAPYGAAAQQVLEKLALWQRLAPRIVRGGNVIQAWQHVESGAAELGLVALASVLQRTKYPYREVSARWHQPIRQDAVLLTAAAGSSKARAFLSFLGSERAQRWLRSVGYSGEATWIGAQSG